MYDHLKKFVVKHPGESTSNNMFLPVSLDSIEDAERRMGLMFPSELRAFYLEIGYGFLTNPVDGGDDRPPENTNRITDPGTIADLYLGNSWMAPSEGFREGDVPFFETADSFYLVLRPGSDRPNAVYCAAGRLIADSFIEFIERLSCDPYFYQKLP